MNIYDEWGGKKKKVHTDYQFQLDVRQKFSKKIIKRNIQCKKFYIGEEVAPKCYKTDYIDQDGELQEKLKNIWQKIPPQNNCHK